MELFTQYKRFVWPETCSYGHWHCNLVKNWPYLFTKCSMTNVSSFPSVQEIPKRKICLYHDHYVKFLKHVWINLQHFMDSFVHRTPWYVHSMCDNMYRACFPLLLTSLLMQQSSRFPKKQVSFPSQVQQIKIEFKLCHHFFFKHCGVISPGRILLT